MMRSGLTPSLIAAPSAGVGTTAGIYLYVRCGTAIYAFNDYLAVTKPTLTSPADNYADDLNPANGVGYSVNLMWNPMGTGSGMVDRVDIEICDSELGFTGIPTTSFQAVSPANPVYTTLNPLLAGQGGTRDIGTINRQSVV